MQFLWGMLNMTQIVTFSPLMGISPPGFVLAFFKHLNFINMEVLLLDPSVVNKYRFLQTFKGWNKNFSLVSIFIDWTGKYFRIIALVLLVILLVGMIAVFLIKSKK